MQVPNRIRSWKSHLVVAAIVGLTLLAAPTAEAQQWRWPQFRGPGGQGHAGVDQLPLKWSETENVTWKTKLEGRAWSSPVIEDGTIWMTTAIDYPAPPEVVKQQEAQRADRQPIVVAARVDFRAIGVNANSGKITNNVFLFSQDFPQVIHGLNSYASPTPIIENGRLYCHFGSYGTCCLDTKTGKLVWLNRDIQVKHENGPGSTPVLYKNLLIVHFDGIDSQQVVAFEKATGKLAWKTKRSGKLRDNPQYQKAYATPLIVHVDHKDLLISPAADWVYAYDPATGHEQWKVPYGDLGFSNVPRPVTGHGMVYICTSFGRSKIMAIRLSATNPEVVWEYNRQAPRMPSPVVVGNEIYFVSDRGIATCLDARTGKENWVKRLGGNYSASPLAGAGRVYFFSREGVTTVIKAGPKFEKLAENRLDGQLMASPAVMPGVLFLRTDQALYRIEDDPSQDRAIP